MNENFNITKEEMEYLDEIYSNYYDDEVEEVNDGYDFD